MSFTKGDVLNTLSDTVTLGMNFTIGAVHISGKSFATIRDHVKAENILVVEGTETLAFYDAPTDILTTQVGNSPANLFQRSLLLHECSHALVDIFYSDNTITRHNDEVAAYFVQMVYTLRNDPSLTVPNEGTPWSDFYTAVYNAIKAKHLESPSGNGAKVSSTEMEPARVLLAKLPDVNYKDFKKTDLSGSNGLKRHNFLHDTHEEVSMRSSSTAREPYPDPSDDYLIETLKKRYAESDVKGYGGRLRELRKDFAKCSLSRAKVLAARLAGRKPGDKVSELFYDHLSHGGRAILLRVLKNRI